MNRVTEDDDNVREAENHGAVDGSGRRVTVDRLARRKDRLRRLAIAKRLGDEDDGDNTLDRGFCSRPLHIRIPSSTSSIMAN